MKTLEEFEPKKVIYYFKELTKIPRGSGNEKEVSNYLKSFAVDRNLEVIQDETLNIIIKKPGTKGYEESDSVILQGHMDMVNEKYSDVSHDFSKDPLELELKGDMLYAKGTTLGADNGIAVAYILSILDSDDLSHPPIEALITVEEETGMLGASSINSNHLSGKTLINLDSEEEGTFLVSCAGGAKNIINLDIKKENSKGIIYKLSVSGLLGGHSGMDIIKERGNAIKIIARVLDALREDFSFKLLEISGGAKNNAIAREAFAYILLEKDNPEILAFVSDLNNILKNEFTPQDKDLKVEINRTEKYSGLVYTDEIKNKVIDILNVLPNGVVNNSQEIKGLVETSLNLGVLTEIDSHLELNFAVRSSVKSRKEYLLRKLAIIAKLFNSESIVLSSYPEWEFKSESRVREIFKKTYQEMYSSDARIEALHAGLECGILYEKMPHLDMISLGPNLYDVHTPNEHMSLSSVKNVYEFLVEGLSRLK